MARTDAHVNLTRVVSGLRRIADRARGFPSPRIQRFLLALVVPLFIAAGIGAFLTTDIEWRAIQILPLLAAFCVAVPLTAVANGWEYETSARLLGQDVKLSSAMRVTVLATALNYLPGHGGAFFRVQTLQKRGPDYRQSGAATLAMGLTWVGIAAMASGILLFGYAPTPEMWIVIALGIGALGLAGLIVVVERQSVRDRLHWTGLILGVEGVSIAVTVLRLYLVMLALNASASLTAAFMLTLAVVLGSVAGLMPGGLGVRELLAGALAPLAGLSPVLGFLVIGVDRVLGLLGHAPLAAYLLRKNHHPAADTGDGLTRR